MSIQSEIDRIEQNIADTYSVLEEAGAPMPASMDSDNLAGTAANIAAVLYNQAQSLTTDQQAQARDNIGALVGGEALLKNTIGTTFPPAQRPAASDLTGYDIDILNSTAADIYSYIDEKVTGKNTVTKEILGKDASGKYDVVRYIFAKRQYIAWQRENYPKMYGWESSSGTSVVPNFNNLKDQCTFTLGKKYSMSGGGFVNLANCAVISVPVPLGETSVVIRLKGIEQNASGVTTFYGGTSPTSFTESCTPSELGSGFEFPSPDSNGVYTFTCPKSADITYICVHVAYDGSGISYYNDTIITVNQPIEYITAGKGYSLSISPRVGDKIYDAPYVGGNGTTTETVTVPAQAAFVKGYRWSGSSKAFSTVANGGTFIVPTKNIAVPFVINLVNLKVHTSYNTIYGGDPTPVDSNNFGNAEAGSSTISVTTASDYIWFMAESTISNEEINSGQVIVNGKNVSFVQSTTTGYVNDIRQESTTTVEVETDGGVSITEVKVATVTSGATINTIPSSRVAGGVEYVRSETDDIEPTVIYTDIDDARNSNASITQDGITYVRYPLGDLGANRTKLTPIFIYANEHGIATARLDVNNSLYDKYETKMCALVAARFLRDLAEEKQTENPFYKYIYENCMIIIVPVANPFGFNINITGDTNSGNDGYYNKNNVNINRNYDTPGWIIYKNSGGGSQGSYPGSENETQYIMNTMVESKAVVAMSLHGIGGFFGGTQTATGIGHCAHQGQNPDGSHYKKETMDIINNFLAENFGYKMVYYDRREEDGINDYNPPTGVSINLPDRACKSPSYITQCGAYGGIVEFQPDDVRISGYQQTDKGYIIENAYAQTINLVAAFLSKET